MAIRVYGDVTIDNYAFEWPGDFRPTYQSRLELTEDPVPGLEGIRSRFVARQFGGAYFLARTLAVALALWNSSDNGSTPLNQRPPWKAYYEHLVSMGQRLWAHPDNFYDVINFFHRITQDASGSYRVALRGREGFTLPNRKKAKEAPLFRCLIDTGDEDPSYRPIELEVDRTNVMLCLFNEGGTRLLREDPVWLEQEPWWNNQRQTWAVVKTHDPKRRFDAHGQSDWSRFFDKLNERLGDHVVLVVKASDLRRNGMSISRSLSWEISVRDVVDGLRKGEVLGHNLPRHIVVVFDFDAALHLMTRNRDQQVDISLGNLVFSTDRGEDEFQSQFNGSIPGAQSMFTGVLAGLIYSHLTSSDGGDLLDDPNLMDRFLTYALIAKQKILEAGLSPTTDDNLLKRDPPEKPGPPRVVYYEGALALSVAESAENSASPESLLPDPRMPRDRKRQLFSNPLRRDVVGKNTQLRKDQAERRLSSIQLNKRWLSGDDHQNDEFIDLLLPADGDPDCLSEKLVRYVQEGMLDKGTPLPICTLGKIKTVSGQEIAALRAIRRLIDSYLARESDRTPLGLAVFGQPGSGKGFAVKSIFETLSAHGQDLTRNSLIECNLSGLTDPEDLAAYFQRARDSRLEGKVPILFFDEFDCTVGEHGEFFWLKYFLAPLQDGKFTSRHQTHPIGKSIFVFAGGIAPTFREFAARVAARNELVKKFNPSDESRPEADTTAMTIKGADFLSRLQGHINIGGLNPENEAVERKLEDRLGDKAIRSLVLRRAIVLRDLLRLRTGSIFADTKENAKADIATNVVKAFLFEGQFDHGVRSIEAVIRMSRVDGRFAPESLPRQDQLEMHVSERFHKRAFGRPL